MRSPLLIESSEFIIEPDTAENKKIVAKGELKENNISRTLCVSEDLNVEETNMKFLKNKKLRWILEPSLDGEGISFEIQKYPAENDSLPSNLENQILSQINTTSPDREIQTVDEEPQKILNPVIYDTFLINLIESAEFEIEDIGGDRIARNSEIGDIIIKSNDLNFSKTFNFADFNDKITDVLVEQSEDLIEDLTNPYRDTFSLKSLSPFFAKHGEKAVEFWSLYKEKIFHNNPLTDSDRCLNQFIDSEKERYQTFQIWYDLISNIKFEMVDLENKEIRNMYKNTISDKISADPEQITFAWRQQEYDWVTRNLLTRYEAKDFAYDSDKLAPNTLIKLSKGNINYIYEVQKYGKCDNLGGEVIPRGWLVETVATSPKDEQIGRKQLYESLKTSNCCRYLTKEEITKCEMCTNDAVKPAISTDDEYSNTYMELKKKEQYEERIKQCLQDGYKMKDITLQDFAGKEKIKFGYDGWHTGTISPQFPINVSINEGRNYKNYGKFEDEGVVSYKSGCKVKVKPDWGEIIGQDAEQLSADDILRKLSDSDYSGNDKLVVVAHNLP